MMVEINKNTPLNKLYKYFAPKPESRVRFMWIRNNKNHNLLYELGTPFLLLDIIFSNKFSSATFMKILYKNQIGEITRIDNFILESLEE